MSTQNRLNVIATLATEHELNKLDLKEIIPDFAEKQLRKRPL